MSPVLIPIHSFVDLITNSSTEIYVSANDKTVGTIREVVDNILVAGGSALKASDLFDFALVVEDPESWPTKMHPVDSDEGKRVIEEQESNDYFVKKCVQITPKKDAPELQQVAKTLSNLRSLFSISARYDG